MASDLERTCGTSLAPVLLIMMPAAPNKPPVEPTESPDDVDFAPEAGPKDTEFKKEKDAKDLTSGGFDLIP